LSRPNHAVSTHFAFAAAVFIAAFSLSGAARADTPVDTAYQSWGIAPRIELEIGPQLAWGLGSACRDEPIDEGDPPVETCSSGFFLLGGQALALIRPFAHWALGAFYAYDRVLGSHDVTINQQGTALASYARSAQRLAFELRWYSRSVSTSGFYIAAHGGALWWADKVEPITSDAVSQLAPEVGFELGGVFAPYRGPGMTLAFQGWLAALRNSPLRSVQRFGSTYGYGPFVFVGLVARLELGFSL
jgi:hypothetical protein